MFVHYCTLHKYLSVVGLFVLTITGPVGHMQHTVQQESERSAQEAGAAEKSRDSVRPKHVQEGT